MKDCPQLVVGISGASGSICGVRMLQLLRGSDVDTHLVLSQLGAHSCVRNVVHC